MPSMLHSTLRSILRSMRPLVLLISGFVLGSPLQAQDDDPNPYSNVQLISEVTSVQPGTPFTVAVHFQMEEGWHNYWRNAGDSGLPTTIEWDLSSELRAGEIQWPTPEAIVAYPLVDYGYSGEVALLVEISPAVTLQEGSLAHLAARVDWLICKDLCLPAHALLEAEVPVRDADPEPDPRWEDLFRSTRASFPVSLDELTVAAEVVEDGYRLRITARNGGVTFPDTVHFFAADESVLAHSEPQRLSMDGAELTLELAGSPYAMAPTAVLRGVLVAEGEDEWGAGGGVRALWVEAPVDGASLPADTAGASSGSVGVPPQESVTLLLALAFAFIGGILLNLMPCVFPVLSLKILGAAGQGNRDRNYIRNQGLFFGLGVEVSFLLLAAILLLLRAGGAHLGWGFQLQSPLFVAGMAALFFGIGLNLMGVFEVGASLTRLGSRQEESGGIGEAVASGALATIIATPCTAPFMGAALGFALTRSVVETLLIFGILGLGMALPYVVLSMAPGLLEKLPRPGPWMEALKQAMAFPMFATVIWLVWVFGQQTGVGGATYLLSALLMVGAAGWTVGRWHRVDLRSGKVARAFSVAALALALAFVARGNAQLPPVFVPQDGWQSYDPDRITAILSSGQPLFLDFTAAWCLTCQVNERLVLSSERIMGAFRERGVALVKADWTRQDPLITQALEALGRSGVPVYALYSGGPGSSPHLLPEVLTEEIVLEALSDHLSEASR